MNAASWEYKIARCRHKCITALTIPRREKLSSSLFNMHVLAWPRHMFRRPTWRSWQHLRAYDAHKKVYFYTFLCASYDTTLLYSTFSHVASMAQYFMATPATNAVSSRLTLVWTLNASVWWLFQSHLVPSQAGHRSRETVLVDLLEVPPPFFVRENPSSTLCALLVLDASSVHNQTYTVPLFVHIFMYGLEGPWYA
jgi:hypothetical protein